MTHSSPDSSSDPAELHTDLTRAERGVVTAERIQLSSMESLRILDLLENPPAPSPTLLAAAKARHTRV